jgi:hypothetical protein
MYSSYIAIVTGCVRSARCQGRRARTASEEAVLGEDGDGVDDEDNYWDGC